MNKRRKYDGKNKRSFIIIVVVAIFIVCIFSLFIYKYNKTSKIQYKIEAGTVLQDVNRNYITVDDDAVLKIGWNDDYYLLYNDEKIVLSENVIAYNTLTGGMKLYGNFYEILSDGKIVEHKNETVLANTTDAKFYKIDDREYLLVDRKISSKDNSIEAGNYLLVELDKAGNAKLSNDKVNLKTITSTILVTSKYTFDISNELLNFGEYDIDLKKIIGSTNQYVPEEEVDDGKGDKDTEEEDNEIGAGIGNGQVGGPGNIVNNNDTGSVPDMDEILDKVKMTSVISVVEGLTQIDVNYVIYDPYNEYKSVYVEVISSGKIDVVYLSKTDTHLVLNNLNADTLYKLNFIYTSTVTDNETGTSEVIPYTFDQFELKTLKPKYSISINKISKVYNTLTYRVDLEKGFNISKVNVNLSFEYDEINPETSEVTKKNASIDSSVDIANISSGYILGKFDIAGYNINAETLLKLTVKSVVASDVEIPINSSSTFRFGR
jgi:hypothetical protein